MREDQTVKTDIASDTVAAPGAEQPTKPKALAAAKKVAAKKLALAQYEE